MTKGIILAGGKGSRLYPMTKVVSKQLLPLYDKPMIYYPLSILLLANIRDILIISTPEDIDNYKKLLGTGERIGVNFEYAVQDKPRGLADAFILGEDFIGNDNVCLILGDNIFYGSNLSEILQKAKENEGATIFACMVKNPKAFGVVEIDDNGKIVSIEEKPKNPKSNLAVPGLYFYDNSVIEKAKSVKPSLRGEIEITSINNEYLKEGKLNVAMMGRGIAWLDTGTPDNMLKAAEFIYAVQSRQGYYISCIEEIAWRKNMIDDEMLRKIGEELSMTDYGQYILSLLKENKSVKKRQLIL